MDPNQIYRQHETERKRQYGSRILEVEQAKFAPLVFSTAGGMGAECKGYHSRLAELVAAKKGESYATTMSLIRARVSFALLRSALLCLRDSRAKRRIYLELLDILDMQTFGKRLQGQHSISYFLLFFLVYFHTLNLIS